MVKTGFTLIEGIVAIGLFLLIATALFGMTILIFEGIGQTRVRHTARLLANEKIEEARNLSYEALGIQGGIPAGPIPATEKITLGGLTFTVKTLIKYIDDPFDNEFGDSLNTDYKRVRIEVSWGGHFYSGTNPVILITDIVPKGAETEIGGGTLSLLVFDSQGEVLPGAIVEIINDQVIPEVNLTTVTDDFGRVILPGAKDSVEGYKVTVSKDGYSTDRTYGIEEIVNPVKSYLTVLEKELTEASFSIDKVSNLLISTYGGRGAGFPVVPDLSFRLRGAKIIGTDIDENEVFKFDEILTTDNDGKVNLEEMEWDNYHLTVDNPAYDFAGSNPLLPLSLFPDTEASLSMSFVPASQNSLLILVADAEEEPLASVSARLVNQSVEYDQTTFTGDLSDPDFGYAYFGDLTNLPYDLHLALEGYEEATSSVQISGKTFQKILLNKR